MISTNTNLAVANEHIPATPIGLPALCQMAFDGLDLAPVWNRLVHRVRRSRVTPPRCSIFRPSLSCKAGRRIAVNCNRPP